MRAAERDALLTYLDQAIEDGKVGVGSYFNFGRAGARPNCIVGHAMEFTRVDFPCCAALFNKTGLTSEHIHEASFLNDHCSKRRAADYLIEHCAVEGN